MAAKRGRATMPWTLTAPCQPTTAKTRRETTRQIAAPGSLSGAAIGGALFGTGMILARGCSSRLLVLAAQGNLRALLSGLVFAVTAQSALSGLLSGLVSSTATIAAMGARARSEPGLALACAAGAVKTSS